ncbi:MAG TPA: hypothetical protein PKD45_05775 [Flavobacteriales bacterium]|nr:hypothetical protein [Flavobacteriales bacterium]
MVRQMLIGAAMIAASAGAAQDTAYYRGAGLLRASGAISPGFMLDAPVTNIYVNGKLEYFVEDRISFRGEAFWYIDSQQATPLMEQNSQLAFGPFLHFGNGRADLATGFEAGLSLAKPAHPEGQPVTDPLRAIPSISLCAGLTYTIWDYFHFFVDARYVHARYTGAYTGTIRLDEVILGGGLGWQLRLRK